MIIFVQHTHDIRFARILPALEAAFDTVVVADEELSGAIERHAHEIGGFVLFHLTELSARAARLLTQERFNAPTTPIAHLGSAGERASLPYGTRHFGADADLEVVAYLSRPRTVRVLVVEDDSGIRDVLRLTLSRHFAVDAAVDGEHAVACLDGETTYDILVLDVMLPKVSGEDVFVHARTVRPNLPILVVTAYDTERRALEFAFRGADGYIAKPFESNLVFRQRLMETLRAHHEAELANGQSTTREAIDRARRAYEARMRAYT